MIYSTREATETEKFKKAESERLVAVASSRYFQGNRELALQLSFGSNLSATEIIDQLSTEGLKADKILQRERQAEHSALFCKAMASVPNPGLGPNAGEISDEESLTYMAKRAVMLINPTKLNASEKSEANDVF